VPDNKEFQKTLKLKFHNPALLEQALVHSSYINENSSSSIGHNERLEFLGDAILDYIVTEKLYRDFPDVAEGEMTKMRAALVRRETLARIAVDIRLGDYLYMGKGEESTGGRTKLPNLAGALEALIAAVYLDLGNAAASDLITRLYAEEWDKLTRRDAVIDYKSKLQQISQSKFQEIPAYRLISESGPDHDKQFRVEVSVNLKVLGSGAGKSKKIAETEAARLALKQLAAAFTDSQ
jgi:ribonuclease III